VVNVLAHIRRDSQRDRVGGFAVELTGGRVQVARLVVEAEVRAGSGCGVWDTGETIDKALGVLARRDLCLHLADERVYFGVLENLELVDGLGEAGRKDVSWNDVGVDGGC